MTLTRLLSGAAVAVALQVAFAPLPASAQPLPAPTVTRHGVPPVEQLVQATIREGWTTARGTRMAALHLRLAPGWMTYWRHPGEAGVAPRFDWSASQNLGDVRTHWPQPVVFEQGGFRTIGYEGELVLPLEVTPARAGRPVVLEGTLQIGVCDEICIPVELSVAAVLRGDGAHDRRIAAALETAARPAREGGLRGNLRCAVAPAARGLELTLRATLPRQGATEMMVVELPGARARIAEHRTWRDGADLLASAEVRAPRGEAVSLDRGQVHVTFLGGSRMLEHVGCTSN